MKKKLKLIPLEQVMREDFTPEQRKEIETETQGLLKKLRTKKRRRFGP